jgi:hypothetical protein
MRFVSMLAIAACAGATPPPREAEPPRPSATTQPRPAVRDLDAQPWSFRWDAGAERDRLPRDAAGLEAEYARFCGPSSPPKLTGSPLLRYRETSYNTSSGVVIVLSPLAGTRDSLLAELRCHQVGLVMSEPADGSPFDVPGLVIDAVGDRYGISLTLTVRDPADLPDLQRRIERGVEDAQRPHHED